MGNSTWLNKFKNQKSYPKLENNETADVIIIGGGIAGITMAYTFALTGKQVVVIDKGTLSESVTAYTTAFLTRVIDTDATDLIKDFGKAKTKKIFEAGEDAIDSVEEVIKKEHIDCEFTRTSYIEYATTSKGSEKLQEEWQAMKDLGFSSELHKPNFLSFANSGSIETPNQAKFHPLKYLLALRNTCEKLGVKFFENTEATGLKGGGKGRMVEILTKNQILRAQNVIVATYNPFKQPLFYFAKKGMYKSYVYELSIPSGLIREGTYADDRNPYHYFRIDKNPDGDLAVDRMIVGGEDHRKAIPIAEERNFHALKDYIGEILGKTPYIIERKWAGPILEPTDGLPLIGRYSKRYPHRYVATAFSGNGMTWGTLAGTLVRDLILGVKNPYEDVFDPGRGLGATILLTKGNDYIGEFIHGALKNYFVSKKYHTH